MQFWGAYWGYNHSKELTPELKQVFYYSPRILTANRRVFIGDSVDKTESRDDAN